MSKVWVLDTETKGTGAHIEPLEKAPRSPERGLNLAHFTPPPAVPAPAAAPARSPRTFRVVDVMGNRVLAEDVRISEALTALAQLRSVHDARVYVWEPPSERWRLLTLAETRALWAFRGADGSAPAGPGAG